MRVSTALYLAPLLLGLPGLSSAAVEAPPEIHALIIGYNGGRAGLAPLRYADDDAVRFSLLLAGMSTAEQKGTIWLLTDIDTDTVLYVLYAGHGLENHVLLKPTSHTEAGFSGHDFQVALSDIAAVDPTLNIYLFVDACRSQSLFAVRGPGSDMGPDLSQQIERLERRAGATRIGILTAATAGKPAGELRSLESGYFSHVLASGLAGAADADGNDVVSFGELAAFVAFNTERLTGQRPWFDPPGGNLNATAIDHRGRRPRLVMSSQPAGHYQVWSASGRPVFAEAFKPPDDPLRLSLPPGQYRVVKMPEAKGVRMVEAMVDLKAQALLDLDDATWSEVTDAALTRGAARGAEGTQRPRTLDSERPLPSAWSRPSLPAIRRDGRPAATPST
jgi:hypothetical protein